MLDVSIVKAVSGAICLTSFLAKGLDMVYEIVVQIGETGKHPDWRGRSSARLGMASP
jgi:hypothetical protein